MRTENRRSRAPQGGLIAATVVAALAAVAPARAEFDYGLSIGAGHSDNIGRTDTDETSETIGVAGFDMVWREQTRRVDADALVDLSYFEYLDDTFDSEVLGTAEGTVVLGIVPERFTWLFQDSFGQAQADPFEPSTPETRENVNYFTTGPDFTLRLGSAAFTRFFGRYSVISYEDSLLDAERASAGFAVGRQISQRSEAALNAVAEQVEFDDVGDQDFDRRHVFVSYELEGSRTELTTELGYTWLERETQDTGGALVNIDVSRQISPSSVLLLGLGTRFTDASESLRSGAGQIGGGAEVTATADPFENRSASLQWNFSRNRTTLTIGAGWNEDRYEEQTLLDRTRLVYDVVATRQLSPALEFGIRGMLSDEEFDETGFTAEELTLGADLSWRLGRTLVLTLAIDHTDRESSGGALGGLGEFDENRAFLTLTYRPRGGTGP